MTRRRSILTQCIAGCLALQLLATAALVTFQFSHFSKYQQSILAARVESITGQVRMMTAGADLSMAAERARVQQLLGWLLRAGDIVYLSVNTPSGNVSSGNLAMQLAVESPRHLQFGEEDWRAGGVAHLASFLNPANEGGGEVWLGVAVDTYRNAVWDTFWDSLWLGVTLITVSIFAMWMGYRRFARWLQRLIGYAKSPSNTSAAEDGDVGRALERMSTANYELGLRVQALQREVKEQTYSVLTAWRDVEQLAVLYVNKQGKIHAANAGIRHLLGYQEQDLLGMDVVNLFHGLERADGIFDEMLSVAAREATCREDHTWVTSSGEAIPVSLEIVSRRDINGTSIGFLLTAADLSKQSKAIKPWQARCTELELQLHERGIELDFMRQHAMSLRRAHDAFVEQLSQELRVPANTIMGFGQLLEKDSWLPMPSYQQRSVREIVSAGGQLLSCISEIIEQSKAQNGGQGFALESISFVPLVQECINTVSGLIHYREVRIVGDITRDLTLAARADRERLQHVLLNALLTLAERCNAGDVLRVETTVSQTHLGVKMLGVSPRFDDAPAMNSPLWPEDGVREGAYPGYHQLGGAKTLVELMGGSFLWEEYPSGHFVLVIELERLQEASMQENSPATSSEPNNYDAKDARERVVLYIEDNAANLRLVKNILKNHVGVRVLGASEPYEGLAMAAAHHPDLVLVDINLPGIDGYEVLRQIQEKRTGFSPPVFAVSASASDSDVDRGLAAGFDQYITKPINVNQFVDTVTSCLAKQGFVRKAESASV